MVSAARCDASETCRAQPWPRWRVTAGLPVFEQHDARCVELRSSELNHPCHNPRDPLACTKVHLLCNHLVAPNCGARAANRAAAGNPPFHELCHSAVSEVHADNVSGSIHLHQPLLT